MHPGNAKEWKWAKRRRKWTTASLKKTFVLNCVIKRKWNKNKIINNKCINLYILKIYFVAITILRKMKKTKEEELIKSDTIIMIMINDKWN